MYAKRHNGTFILRIEDTDQKRSVEGATDYLMAGLRWFGIEWDEGPDVGGDYGPYVQSERKELYVKWAHWLVENGYAYKCFATAEELKEIREALLAKGDYSGYDRRYREMPASSIAQLEAEGRPYVIRFKMPLDGTTIVPDLLRGDVEFENKQTVDPVLLKSTGMPTYHLAHPIDDHFMQISHVTRGIEWLPSAPLHVQLFKAFDWELPIFVHLPVILNPSGKGKLSKRTQAFLDSGEKVLVRADEFREAGYLRPALLNFLANVGWNFGDDIEKFTIEDAIARFDLADVSPSPVKLPYSKLDWLNGQYIQDLDPVSLAYEVRPFLEEAGYLVDVEDIVPLMPALSTRLKRLPEALDFIRFMFDDEPLNLTADELTHNQMDKTAALEAFSRTKALVYGMDELEAEVLGAAMREIGESVVSSGKAGPFLGKARLAMTGQKVSPPLFESMVAMGRKKCLVRLEQIVTVLTD
jgi:glutamyl-tRNA synthetase